jgi:hypothetical protein
MRWWVVTVPAALLSGCENLKDIVSARAEVAAQAQGQQLEAERLAEVMASVKGLPLTQQAAEVVANTWVDHMLFAQAVAAGRDLADSATAAAALWPQLTEARATHWHDTLLARRNPMSPAVADSIYDAEGVRVLQHILFRAQASAKPEERAAARRKAEQAGRQVASGADFARLARELSEDPGSKAAGGYLPPAPRGQWVTAFDSAGWRLKPGEITGVIESPFGYHIVRRPPVAEVRDKLLDFARARFGASLDSVYLRELGQRKNLKVHGGAPARMRQALADRDDARADSSGLAAFDGGRLTVADFIQWVTALGPSLGGDLGDQPDSVLVSFARTLGENALLLREADSAGMSVSEEEWRTMLAGYRGELDSLRAGFGLSGSDLIDPAVPADERAKLAALRLRGYWDRIADGSQRPRPVPPLLAVELRREAEYKVIGAGLRRAVELAVALKAKADSAPPARQPAAPPPPAGGSGPGAAPPAPGGQ